MEKRQYSVSLDDETIAKIDKAQKQQSRPSRSNTMAYLIELGLKKIDINGDDSVQTEMISDQKN